jgi:hypothetical protein
MDENYLDPQDAPGTRFDPRAVPPQRLRDYLTPGPRQALELGLRAMGVGPGGNAISLVSDLARYLTGDLLFPVGRRERDWVGREKRAPSLGE